MSDAFDADSSPSDADSPVHWYEKRWTALCELLGTNDPAEVVPRVRTLQEQFEALDEQTRAPEGLVTISEVEEVFQEMHEKLQSLRERNEALVEQLEDDDGSGMEAAFKELHRDTEDLLDALGATSIDEAQERVQSMNEQLDNLYREKERLVEAGLTSADEALEEFNRLQAERDELMGDLEELQETNDVLQQEKEELQAQVDAAPDPSAAPSADVEALRSERDALESTVEDLSDDNERLREEVDALEAENEQLQEQNGHLQSATRDLQDELKSVTEERDRLEAETSRLNSNVEQLESRLSQLREQQSTQRSSPDTSVLEAASAVKQIIGVESPGEAQALAHAVEEMHERLRRLSAERSRMTEEAGVGEPGDVLDMIESMEAQLKDLYSEREQEDLDASGEIPEAVAEILGISSADDAEDLAATVRRMGDRLQALAAEQQRLDDRIGTGRAEDVAAMIESMEAQLVDLYEERDDRGTGPAADVSGTAEDAAEAGSADGDAIDPDAADAIRSRLGVTSVEDARELEELIRTMTGRLERLSDEHRKLEEAGLTVDTALAMIGSMEDQLVDLYEDRDADRRAGAPPEPDTGAARKAGPDTDPPTESNPPSLFFDTDDAAAPEETDARPSPDAETQTALLRSIREELGVTSPEEVDELSQLIRSMTAQLNHLSEQQSRLASLGLSFENALVMIENMEEQLVDLYEERERDEDLAVRDRLRSLQEILGVESPEEARELESLVHSMEEQLQSLVAEKQAILQKTGLETADSISAMIESMEEQLVDLYEEREKNAGARDRLQAIDDVLGISTRAEAEELANLARSMEQQLDDLYEDKQELEALGLNSVEDAVNMVTSMENQLVELYEDKESVQDLETLAAGPEQDTFQQLEALYAEQEKLKRELGVASADEIIEMVEGLSTQLDELYENRDAERTDEIDLLLPEDYDTESLSAGNVEAADEAPASPSGANDLIVASMREQLEALYVEKEALLERGMSDAHEAVDRIDTLQDQIRTLQRQMTEYEERLERLRSETGASSITEVINTVQSMPAPSEGASADDDATAQAAGASSPAGDAQDTESLLIDAAPQFVDDETLSRLEDMSTAELDDLDVGAIRLADDGQIEYVNEAGRMLPGLEKSRDRTTIHGQNFFLEVAPSTNNNLFYGRFQQGVDRGAMDARFPYTFIKPGQGPSVLQVHLHRKRDRGVNWLLFRPM
jgi:photoactive yellow protein